MSSRTSVASLIHVLHWIRSRSDHLMIENDVCMLRCRVSVGSSTIEMPSTWTSVEVMRCALKQRYSLTCLHMVLLIYQIIIFLFANFRFSVLSDNNNNNNFSCFKYQGVKPHPDL